MRSCNKRSYSVNNICQQLLVHTIATKKKIKQHCYREDGIGLIDLCGWPLALNWQTMKVAQVDTNCVEEKNRYWARFYSQTLASNPTNLWKNNGDHCSLDVDSCAVDCSRLSRRHSGFNFVPEKTDAAWLVQVKRRKRLQNNWPLTGSVLASVSCSLKELMVMLVLCEVICLGWNYYSVGTGKQTQVSSGINRPEATQLLNCRFLTLTRKYWAWWSPDQWQITHSGTWSNEFGSRSHWKCRRFQTL